MKRPSDQDSEESRAPKRPKTAIKLYDISPILDKWGDVEFYKDRFFRWRQINNRDDPRQSHAAKLDSWRTFVRLENEHEMERLLRRGANRAQEWTPRSAVSDDDATGCSRTRERHQERQTPMSGEVPMCRRSVDTQATGLDRSVGASSNVASFDLREQGSTQQSNDALRDGQSTEVGVNAVTIDRLWRWRRHHGHAIETLQERLDVQEQYYKDLEDRCEASEKRCAAFEARFDDLETLVADQMTMIGDLRQDLSRSQGLVVRLEKNLEDRARQHDRFLASVEEAGKVLETQRHELDRRLQPLESVHEQAYDVLQRLHAEKQLQGDELSTLRDQVDQLQILVDKLRRNH
jgi:hypothetical protein